MADSGLRAISRVLLIESEMPIAERRQFTGLRRRVSKYERARVQDLPRRASSLLKKYEISNTSEFQDFERELRVPLARIECAFTEEAPEAARTVVVSLDGVMASMCGAGGFREGGYATVTASGCTVCTWAGGRGRTRRH